MNQERGASSAPQSGAPLAATLPEAVTFRELGLPEPLLRAVDALGFERCTPIQQEVLPYTLLGHDCIGKAQTGTGQTSSFLLTIMSDLLTNPLEEKRYAGEPRALVIAPTRELVLQIGKDAEALARYTDLQVVTMIGGVDYDRQRKALHSRLVDILVATPGRLMDFHSQREIHLDRIELLVIDEADRMLDMGFIRDIRRVLAALPRERQNLLFSATFSDEIRALVKGLLHDPVTVEVAARNAPAELVEHRVHLVEQGEKRAVLSHLLREGATPQTLVFTRTKHGANRLAEQLARDGLQCAAIHGNKSQSARTRALADFKAYKVQVLVATDIAARGLDISELPQVVNYELPHVPEDYVHRIGRTGRAGSAGQALSLVSDDEHDRLRAIERVLGRKIQVLPFNRSAIRVVAPEPMRTARSTASHPQPRPASRARPPRRWSGGADRAARRGTR